MKVHFDLETGDPDDVMTLALLCTHPKVDLVGITVFPGDPEQVWLVKRLLEKLGKDVKVGASACSPKNRVSPFYRKWLGLGEVKQQEPDDNHVQVLRASSKAGAHLITGAALSNIYGFSLNEKFEFDGWTCQGGFAGDNVVPLENRLEKFAGKTVCPTYNLNGDVPAAKHLLLSGLPMDTRMVSKNVCHRFVSDVSKVKTLRGFHAGLDLVCDAMEMYGSRQKALHDLLAASMAVHPELGSWVVGFPYCEREGWGFLPDPDSNVRILVGVNTESVWDSFRE